MNQKKYGITFICLFFLFIVILISINIIVDPFFHYHKPLSKFNYLLKSDDQRYINDGIVKNYSYNAIITGTSLTNNFKTSEFNELFNVNSIKVPLSGAFFKEITDLLQNAFKNNNNIKYVIRTIEYNNFFRGKDELRYDNYPEYLYNDTMKDDLNYLLNKNTLYKSIFTINNKVATTFDNYSYLDNNNEGNLANYNLKNRPQKQRKKKLSDIDIYNLKSSIKQNFIKLVEENPNTQFYFFYPPYSIYYWDYVNQKGTLYKELMGEEIITEMLLKYDNVHLFSFLDIYDLITNPSYYIDYQHYNAEINSMILQSMKNGEHELRLENYKKYYDEIINYTNYDYDSLFKL